VNNIFSIVLIMLGSTDMQPCRRRGRGQPQGLRAGGVDHTRCTWWLQNHDVSQTSEYVAETHTGHRVHVDWDRSSHTPNTAN